MRDISSLSDIADDFDAVLVDQFGVLHDGRKAFPGTQECIARLAAKNVPIVALSNSGKRADLNVKRLERLGFASAHFLGVVTSGELAYSEISQRLASGALRRSARISVLSRDNDTSMIDGLDVRHVACDEVPDLLIIAGVEPETQTLESYLEDVAPLAASGVTALCINPDLQIYSDGLPAFGPGLLAERYRELGGPVEMLGKPGARMFATGLRLLGNPPPERCLMIGDSAEHDIAGARAAGCLSLLITSGIQSAVTDDADFRMGSLVYK